MIAQPIAQELSEATNKDPLLDTAKASGVHMPWSEEVLELSPPHDPHCNGTTWETTRYRVNRVNRPAHGPQTVDPNPNPRVADFLSKTPDTMSWGPGGGLMDCLKLVEESSRADYEASSRGWDPVDKKEEMQNPYMNYITVTEHKYVCHREPETRQVREIEHADLPKKIVGFISFMFEMDEEPYDDEPICYIYEIHLAGGLRGKGMGTRLIQKVEMIARVLGLPKAMLTVFTRNKGARQLYERLGFTKDRCSPPDRVMRRRVVEAEYAILSKTLAPTNGQ